MYTRTLQPIIELGVSSFLFGPRQCGKTTLLLKLKPQLYIDLLKTKDFLRFNLEPSLVYDQVSALGERPAIVVIDEVQKVPAMLDEVQRCADQMPHITFVLSGSSARKLKRGGANLLGGRFADLKIFPLTIEELGLDFDLDQALRFGTLPRIYSLLKDNKSRAALQLLRSYVTTYLAEEIKAEALVRSLDHFQRFLEVAAQQYAREINQRELAHQAQISPSSIQNYFSILEDTMIGFYLNPHSTSIRKQLTKTPKFYFFDNGVVRAIQGLGNSLPTNQEKGLLFEQFMIQEAARINSYYEKDLKLSFWRTASGAEVDLLLSRGSNIILSVEFKATKFPSRRDISGLRAFAQEHPKVQRLLCAPVDTAQLIDDVRVITPSEFGEVIKQL